MREDIIRKELPQHYFTISHNTLSPFHATLTISRNTLSNPSASVVKKSFHYPRQKDVSGRSKLLGPVTKTVGKYEACYENTANSS